MLGDFWSFFFGVLDFIFVSGKASEKALEKVLLPRAFQFC
jgi:hypothetical protein